MGSGAIQGLVDALGVALRRPVLLDDPEMAPIAYSPQWGPLDPVRTRSILRRAASPEVRAALLEQGVADARGATRTSARPELELVARVCVPVRRAGRVAAYLWLLDPACTLGDDDLARAQRTAQLVARCLGQDWPVPATEHGLALSRLCGDGDRDAAASLRAGMPPGPLVLCLVAPGPAGTDTLGLVRRASRLLSVGHAVVSALEDEAALLVSCKDPVVEVLGARHLAGWLHKLAEGSAIVGQSGLATDVCELPAAARRARIALAVAHDGPSHAAWDGLGANRLVAQLPIELLADAPEPLARLIEEDRALADTLTAFLDAGGSVKATAASLSLHRSGVYYRLRAIEESTGLDLDDGDHRLLAHVAVRLARRAERMH